MAAAGRQPAPPAAAGRQPAPPAAAGRQPAPPAAAGRYRWVVLGVGAAGAAAFSMLRMGLPSLGPAIRAAYGLSLGQVGLVFAAVSVGVMVTLVPWGILTDRIGERPVLAGGLVGTAAALTGTAFAPSFSTLLAGLALAGMLGASSTGASGRAVMGWFARTERGFALGIRQMALPLGGALASLFLPHVVGVGGLRAALLVLAGISLTAALSAAIWMRDAPPPPPTVVLPAAPIPTRDRRIWRLGAGSALLVVSQSSLVGFVVLFLHDARGLAPATAAAGLAAIQLGGAVTRIAAGRSSDREGMRIAPIRRIAIAGAVLLATTAALVDAPGAVLYPVLLAAGITAMTWNGLAFTAAAEISGRKRAGTAMSVQNTLIAVGTALAPALFGAVVDASSWSVAYGLCALAPLAAYVVLGPLVDDEEDRVRERARRRQSLPATLSP